MKRFTPIRFSLSVAVMMASQTSWAVGTTAGTEVKNTATLSYSIGGTPQASISSEESEFLVDRKVDLTVTGDKSGTSHYIVAPLSEAANSNLSENELRYKLNNEGNSDQAFEISVSQLGADDFDALNCQVEVEDGSGGSVAGGASVSITNKPRIDMPEDATYDILVSCDMPDLGSGTNEVSDADLSTLEVLATAVASTDPAAAVMAESTTESEGVIDTVLADGIGGAADENGGNGGNGGAVGDRNAMHSAVQTYEIDSPELSVTKTSAVISDPFNGTTNPKRIPGAVIEYTITISNASDKEAEGVQITDTIDTDGSSGSGPNTVSFVGDSSDIVIVDASGSASGNYDGSVTNPVITATGITVPAASSATTPGTATVKFRVTID